MSVKYKDVASVKWLCFVWFMELQQLLAIWSTYKTKLVLSVLLVLIIGGLLPSRVLADSYTFSTRSDWDAGAKVNLETESKEGELKIESDGVWGARNWKTPDLTVSVGSAFASDGTDIYMIRGVGDNYFAKYSPNTDDWTELSPLPFGTYYGADMEILDGYVYVLSGGYQKAFVRYSIANNTWENLTDVPDLVYEGGSIATDGTDIYALRGYYSQDFYKYDVSENSWSPMSGTPARVRRGADLVRVGNYIYTPRGYNTTTFYRYDINNNTWSTMAHTPDRMYDDVNYTTDGTSIFATRGNNTKTFYKYNIAANTWSTIAATPATVRYSGAVYHSGDGYVYVFRGNNQYQLWKYDIANDEFVGTADAPSTLYTGSDLLYYDNYLYTPRGYNQTTFYRYSLANNTWETLAAAPDRFYDDTKGVVAGAYIYFYRGSNTSTFWRYDPATDAWTEMAATPSTVRYGGTLSYPGSGDYIYGTRGANTYSFWRYSISGDSWDDVSVADLPTDAEASYGSRTISDGTDIYYIAGHGISRLYKYDISADAWTELASPSFAPYYGTDMSYANGKIYALAGWYETNFWEYNIATDAWRQLDSMAGYYATDVGPYAGASIEYDNSTSFYISRGGAKSDIINYTPSSNDYVASGTWTSTAQDLSYVSSWTSLTSDSTTPGDSSISFQTRTSADNISWTNWQDVSGGTIASTVQRYIQVKAVETASSNQEETPILESISINYVGDVGDPSNPDTTTGFSQEIGGDQLASGGTYRYTQPYFSWSGASDAETSVAGYYVYFGTSASADPETEGIYQTTSNYTASIEGTGTYYLIIKTKDAAGNVSSSVSSFTYHYNGISPVQSVMADETAEFLGEATNVNLQGDKIKLASKPGFWLQERLSLTPGRMQYGAKNVAYVESSNKLYVFRGNNSKTFYEYDVASDTWSTKSDAPDKVRMGGGVVEGPEGYLYGMRGNNSTSFWRYNIETDTWSDEDAVDTPLTIYYGGSLVYDGSQYIYVMRGYNDDAYWRYNTQANEWETLATVDFGATSDAVNNSAYVSADLAIDQANQLVYATQGSLRDGFSVYDINTNKWTVLPDVPALPYLGSSIEFDDDNNTIYYMPGYNTDYLFKYDVASETWTKMSSAPAVFYYGGSIKKIGDSLYAIRGSNSTSFYKYDIAKDSWLSPTRGLFGTEFRGSSYLNVHYGADIVKGDGNNFYLTRGNYANNFVRYNSSTGVLTKLANTPAGVYNGAAMVYESTNNKIYATVGQYLQKFYVYDIATDVWIEEASDPIPANVGYGASMVYDGSRYIYLNRGGNGNQLYRFDTQGSNGSKWATMANAPAGLGYGAELSLQSGYIYTLRGQNVANNPLYRYDISANTWSTDLSNIGLRVYNDGFMTNGGNGYLYAARGQNDTKFRRYSISSDTWSDLAAVPANVYVGGSGESNGNDKIFVMPGSGTNTYADGLYTYVMQTDASSFEESGNYITQSHDLSSVYKWTSLQTSYSLASNSSLSIQTRSSVDNSTWSSWTAVSKEKLIGSVYNYQINSPAARYLQLKFIFTSSDGIGSATLDSYTIKYFQDINPPTNPTDAGLSVYSDDSPGTAIVSNTWYAHPHPYFDWPDAEETNGASDNTAESGVAGYYVYFGTDQNADPEVDGTYQLTSDYTASNLVSGNTYYFRLKTKDDANNNSTATWAPFVYKYDGDGPTTVTDLVADPAGYSSTNSFDFSWSEASSSGAAVTGYCYKTDATEGDYATDQCTTTTSVTAIPATQVGANTFYVRTQDAAGNYSDYVTTSYFYADIDNAPAPPTNLTVTPEVSVENSFAFDWDPPEAGTFFGSVSNLSYYYSINALPTASSVSSTSLTDLIAGAYATLPGENMFYITTMDEAGNINYNDYASIAFTANTTAPGIPLNIDIADVSVKATESWKLAVSWESPEQVGAGVSNYKIYRSTDAENYELTATSGGASYVDVGLDQEMYYYKVKACDNTNNCGAFSEVVNYLPDGKFTTAAPLISDPVASGVTTKKAIISWSTSRTCDSKLAYGTGPGDYFEEEVSNSEHVTDHQLTVSNLSPGTVYYFTAKWTDEDGNTGESAEFSFETDPPPSTKEPVVKSAGLDSALLQFTSKNAAKVRIYYGESSAFGGSKDVVTGTEEGTHTVELSDLKDGTKYYYKINTFDVEDEEYEGEIHSFETLPRPQISKINIQQVKGTAKPTLLLTWTSNTEISSIVTYYPTSAPSMAQDEVNIALKAGMHRIVLFNLEPEASYSILIKGKDVVGNEAVGEPQQITTSADTRPPQISNVKADGEIIGVGEEATAQLVISYDTDEAATAQVEYGEGSGATYAQKTQEDGNFSSHHLVVISELTPSKIYHLRVLSKDKANNLAQSIDKVVITPKSTESAFNLVVTNMSSMFSFLGSIKQ